MLTCVDANKALEAIKLMMDQFIVIYWLGCVLAVLTDPICGKIREGVQGYTDCTVHSAKVILGCDGQ